MDIDQSSKTERGEIIADRLIKAIREDEKINSSDSLSFAAVKDNLPAVCQTIMRAIATRDLDLLVPWSENWGSQHGVSRSAQDFEPREIVREFYLLKQIIIAELKSDLLSKPCEEIVEEIAFVDVVLNKAMESTFCSYALLRKEQVKSLHQQIFFTNQEISRLVADNQDTISYLIHEIKNPLTSIIGYSDLFLRQHCYDTSTANLEHIEQVLRQGRNVLRLVNDTTELSSSQKGNLKLHVRQIEVCTLLEDITSSLKPFVEAKNLSIVASCYPQQLVIESDSLRLQQIITNLLTNAIRYTTDGTIELTCLRVGNNLEIKVTDTGIGISQHDCDRIFEPYFRTHESQENVPEGVGLGLAIVSHLVTILGGKIELTSKVGVGSTFVVTIPFVKSIN